MKGQTQGRNTQSLLTASFFELRLTEVCCITVCRQAEAVVRGDSEVPERFYEDASGRLRSTKKKMKKRRSASSTERSSGGRAPVYA